MTSTPPPDHRPDHRVAPLPAVIHLDEDRWRIADDAERASSGAAFLALLRGEGDGAAFTPNVTVTGELRTDDPDVADLGDRAAAQLAGTVEQRRLAGTPEAPGLSQRVAFGLDSAVGHLDLVQVQVLVMARDVDPGVGGRGDGVLVYLLALTALPDQLAGVIEDFQAAVASFRVGDQDAIEASRQ